MQKINGTLRHFALGIFAVFLSMFFHREVWPAIYVMATVEFVQADVFGWRTLFSLDTGHDVVMDAFGGLVGFGFYWMFIATA